MDRPRRRSKGVSEIAVAAVATPSDADVAFEQLYRSSRDDVYAYVAGLLHDRSAAEDVTSTAFERAHRKRRSYDPRRGTQRAWLFGIARNAALDELRRRKRTAELVGEPVDEAAMPVDETAALFELRVTLRSALATLSPRERELVALKYFAGLGNAEIAALTGTTESNAGTRLHRTIEKLREACRESI
jgi:RNA polymerase sigma-70 factor, ECF subfamily